METSAGIDSEAAPVRQFTAEEIAHWEAENTKPLPQVRPDFLAARRRRQAFEAARARTGAEKKKA
jgi:hypothetical protein